jgi:hypothetical protein
MANVGGTCVWKGPCAGTHTQSTRGGRFHQLHRSVYFWQRKWTLETWLRTDLVVSRSHDFSEIDLSNVQELG